VSFKRLDHEFIQQLGNGLVDELAAVVGVKAANHEGKLSQHGGYIGFAPLAARHRRGRASSWRGGRGPCFSGGLRRRLYRYPLEIDASRWIALENAPSGGAAQGFVGLIDLASNSMSARESRVGKRCLWPVSIRT